MKQTAYNFTSDEVHGSSGEWYEGSTPEGPKDKTSQGFSKCRPLVVGTIKKTIPYRIWYLPGSSYAETGMDTVAT